jgi:putative transposase
MRKISNAGYRFPPEVIHQAIWLYLRFTLSFRDVEDLLAERGIAVSYETSLGEPLRADDRRAVEEQSG